MFELNSVVLLFQSLPLFHFSILNDVLTNVFTTFLLTKEQHKLKTSVTLDKANGVIFIEITHHSFILNTVKIERLYIKR